MWMSRNSEGLEDMEGNDLGHATWKGGPRGLVMRSALLIVTIQHKTGRHSTVLRTTRSSNNARHSSMLTAKGKECTT